VKKRETAYQLIGVAASMKKLPDGRVGKNLYLFFQREIFTERYLQREIFIERYLQREIFTEKNYGE
jgi:hypothetical protein